MGLLLRFRRRSSADFGVVRGAGKKLAYSAYMAHNTHSASDDYETLHAGVREVLRHQLEGETLRDAIRHQLGSETLDQAAHEILDRLRRHGLPIPSR